MVRQDLSEPKQLRLFVHEVRAKYPSLKQQRLGDAPLARAALAANVRANGGYLGTRLNSLVCLRIFRTQQAERNI